MSRYVDTDVLKAKLMEYIGLTNGFERAFNEAPTIEIPTWIPCSERLPEEPFGCLVTVYWEDPYSGKTRTAENITRYIMRLSDMTERDGITQMVGLCRMKSSHGCHYPSRTRKE